MIKFIYVLNYLFLDYPLAKVLVQIVHLKECNKPGYNLMPLRKLLNNYYGYPMERWHSDDIFQDLYDNFLSNQLINKKTYILLNLICYIEF